MDLPQEFSQVMLGLEIDLGDKGGIQRLNTVGDFEAWLNEEKEFWYWTNQPPARNHGSNLGNMTNLFDQFYQQSPSRLSESKARWDQTRPRIEQLQETSNIEDKTPEERNSIQRQIVKETKEIETLLDRLRNELSDIVDNEILKSRNHFSRLEPKSQYIHEISESDPEAAFYALDQFILDEKQSNERRRAEHTGRMLADLYTKNLSRKLRPEKAAFREAIVTWSNELKDFKSRYEALEARFAEISDRHRASDESWQKRSDQLAEDFTRMRQSAEDEMKTLRDTYDSFMQLEAPREYWKKKRDEHENGKKVMGWAASIVAVLGAGLLALAAWFLLPQFQSAGTIPWRQIGFFFLASTFVIWINRLMVRLMLSHIHLYADAREREVMISTFLALMHQQESREGLQKEDIALVPAPIFRPSTTGVTKDDGGPSSFGDFLGHLTGGRS